LYDFRHQTDNARLLRSILDESGKVPDMIILTGIIRVCDGYNRRYQERENYRYFTHLRDLATRLLDLKHHILNEQYYALLRERINYEDPDEIIPKGGKRIKRRNKSRRNKTRRNKSRRNKTRRNKSRRSR
jgi:hypothetical protein